MESFWSKGHSNCDPITLFTNCYDKSDPLNFHKLDLQKVTEFFKEHNLKDFQLKDNKDNKKALNAREAGKKFLMKRDFTSALQCFNECLCYAEPFSEHLGAAFAYRSDIYYTMKRFKMSLENIKLAKDSNCPHYLVDELNYREMQCFEKIKVMQTVEDDSEDEDLNLKLSGKAHSKIPYIDENLAIKFFEGYGNGVIATSNLKVGDVIIAEKPAIQMALPAHRFRRCHFCNSVKYLNLYPCENCAGAMFCSQKCQEMAQSEYHKYECEISYALNYLCESMPKLHASIRMIWLALNGFHGQIDQLIEALVNDKGRDINPFDTNYNNLTKKDLFFTLYSYKWFERPFGFDINPEINLLLKVIFQVPILSQINLNDGQIEYLKEMLKNCIKVTSLITFRNKGNTVKRCYAISSLLNHSCAPNTDMVGIKETGYYIVKRPIKAGEQILISYGPNSNDHEIERRKKTFCDLRFDCLCIACSQNYPTLEEILEYPKLAKEGSIIKQLADKVNHDKKLQLLQNFLEKHDHLYPTKELDLAWKIYRVELFNT